MAAPRIAYFPDSFHEVNGVAHTSRNFEGYATRHGIDFLCVRAGPREAVFESVGSVRTLELARSVLSVPMEHDLAFDPLFFRHAAQIERALRDFDPNILHITGPSELGIFGAYFAWKLGLPLAASWHTNVHEYAARRASTWLRALGMADGAEKGIESGVLHATARFYRLAKVLYAPSAALCRMLESLTARPCHLMQRGVETDRFAPSHRTRAPQDGRLVLGFVGRLSIEKNVALLPLVSAALRAQGIRHEWTIVGQGDQEAALRAALPDARFAGVLQGAPLASAYADMDLFVFPSHTDTFGNVVLEALASGVPAIVTPDGGPATIVRDGVTGRIAADADFVSAIAALAADGATLQAMRHAARADALGRSWDAVFDGVLAAYPV